MRVERKRGQLEEREREREKVNFNLRYETTKRGYEVDCQYELNQKHEY